MRRAPFTTVLMAALLGAAPAVPAHKVADVSVTPPPVDSLDRRDTSERPGTNKAARSNTVLISEQNPASSQMIPSAYRDVDRIAPKRPSPVASQVNHDNSDWHYTAAWLGTLAIIATIAFRRRKAGTPWA